MAGEAVSEKLPPAVVEWVLTQLPIRKEQGAAWNAALDAGLTEPALVALRLHAAGLGVNDAAKAAGYASHAEVSRKAREFGFVPVDRAGVGQVYGRIVGLGADELIRRLENKPEKVSDSVLNAITGTAADKKAVAEGWSAKDAREGPMTIDKFFARLGQTPRRVSLDVPERERDVTPVAPRGNGAA